MLTLREAALNYGLRGWHIFPCYPQSKRPHGGLVPRGMNEATPFITTIGYWWEREPEANIGLHCRKSGLIVLDVDPRNGGDVSWLELERNNTDTITISTLEQTTPGGWHMFFKHPGVRLILKKELAEGIDIKDNGYILLSPSPGYWWSTEMEEPEQLSNSLLDLVLRPSQETHKQDSAFCHHGKTSPLLQIPAIEYIYALTGREAPGGFVQCPFHAEGKERTPSLRVNGRLWACFGCEPTMGKEVQGGNLVDFAALLWGYPVPVSGVDLAELMSRLQRKFQDS